jgi:hypothetical protein
MPNLRKKLIRLAYTEPSLRGAVVGLLRSAELVFISNAARKAFDAELLPQVEASATTPEQVETVRAHLHTLLDEAMRDKNNLYLLLIRYKSNDAGDAQFFDDLKIATDEWAKAQSAPAPAPEPTPAPAPAPPPPPPPAPAPIVMPQMPVVQPQIVMAPMPMPIQAPPPPPQPSTTTTTITTVKTGRRTKR